MRVGDRVAYSKKFLDKFGDEPRAWGRVGVVVKLLDSTVQIRWDDDQTNLEFLDLDYVQLIGTLVKQ